MGQAMKLTPLLFAPGNSPPFPSMTSTEQGAVWASRRVWKRCRRERYLVSAATRTGFIRCMYYWSYI